MKSRKKIFEDLTNPKSAFRKKMLKEWKEWLDYKERNKKTA